jgi:cis-3-alkyl-4-acyloxetan-2-one decarboxylase
MWGSVFRRPPVLHIAGDSGAGPVVVMIHGIASSSSATFQNLVPLLEHSHRCILIDLLGFGESPAPAHAEYTLEEHVAALAATIATLKLTQPFVLVGHSLGALIAARYAARFRKHVSHLVLVSPPVYLAPAELADSLDRARQDFYLRAYRFLRDNQDFTVRNAAIVERILPIRRAIEITPKTWTPFVKSLQNAIEAQTTISDLAAVRVPTDVVYGTLDEFASPGGMRIVARLTGVTMHRVRASSHLIRRRLARAVARVIDAASASDR